MTRAEVMSRRSEIARLLAHSRAELDSALLATWTLGTKLRDKRHQVRESMGRSGWPEWLRVAFPGKTAVGLRCMRFAEEISSPACIPALSLRQAYFCLGVSTEPKLRSSTRQRRFLAGYVRNAQRLLIELRRQRSRRAGVDLQRVRADLAPLTRELALLFRENPAEQANPTRSRHTNPNDR